MMYHKFDPETKIYTESVESDSQPEHSTIKVLPEITEYYTVAFIENKWVSVLKPEFEIIANEIKLKNNEEIPAV